MFPGMNNRQAQQMMKKMGIQQQEIDAQEVIIKTKDKVFVITSPSVQKVNMMGQDTFQVSGEIIEQEYKDEPLQISQEDIDTIIEQVDVSAQDAQKALEETNGDLAQAIINLQS